MRGLGRRHKESTAYLVHEIGGALHSASQGQAVRQPFNAIGVPVDWAGDMASLRPLGPD